MQWTAGALVAVLSLAACSTPAHITASTPPRTLHQANGLDCNTSPLPVSNQHTYQDADGIVWVFGLVQNSTFQDIPLTRLCITFMKDGVPQMHEWMLDTSLQSGESVPFRAVMQDKSIPADTPILVTAQMDERVIASHVSYREFSSDVMVTPDEAGKLHFSGIIHNTGQKAASNIRIVIGIYGEDQQLIGVANGRISSLGALNSGEETIFTANTSKLLGSYASYKILIEGDVIDDALIDEP